MADDDWYRRTTWTPEFEREFEDRLSRSRGQRGEYLRIQAWTLASSGDPGSARHAITLAQRYLEENHRALFTAQAHHVVALASTLLGDNDAAIAAYRRAVASHRATPNAHGLEYVDFAWFAATQRRKDLYAEVTDAMRRDFVEGDLLFPATQYKYFGALAMISSDFGDAGYAGEMARRALAAAASTHSGLSRHPTAGLVRGGHDEVRKRLERLAVEQAHPGDGPGGVG